MENSTRSMVSVDNSFEDLGNSHSTLCAGLSKKLKVKSNRGRPRKRIVHPRNPFEIGSRFRFKRNKKMSSRNFQQKRAKELLVPRFEVIQSRVVGSSVKEALEILATTENMGLEIVGEREVVIQEIARRLDRREL